MITSKLPMPFDFLRVFNIYFISLGNQCSFLWPEFDLSDLKHGMLFFRSEFKPKKIKTENDKKAKKRKPVEVSKGYNIAQTCSLAVFCSIFWKAQLTGETWVCVEKDISPRELTWILFPT